LRRRLVHLELAANAAARPPAFVRYLLPDGTMETVTNSPPGACFILGVREAESVEAWQRDNMPPE
jgi:hypothetical protein